MDIKSAITPLHLTIAVAAVIVAIVLLPMISSAYQTAYPPIGSTRRFMIDKCSNDDVNFNRWSESDVAMCLAMESLRSR